MTSNKEKKKAKFLLYYWIQIFKFKALKNLCHFNRKKRSQKEAQIQKLRLKLNSKFSIEIMVHGFSNCIHELHYGDGEHDVVR